MTGARGGDGSRDATRRTWRDDLSSVAHSAEEEVSGHGAARRIKVAQQPTSKRPEFVVARSAKHAGISLRRQLPLHKYFVAPDLQESPFGT